MKRRLAFLLALPLLTGLILVSVVVGNAAAFDQKLAACGGSARNKVLVSFDMARAADYRSHLPQMKLSPELDTNQSATVIVFAGDYYLADLGPLMTRLGGPQVSPIQHGVVCVFTNGFPEVYADVDTTGMTP